MFSLFTPTSDASESQTQLNKDLSMAKFGGWWSPKTPSVNIGPWPSHHSVCNPRHQFSEGGTCCSVLEKCCVSFSVLHGV